MENVAAPIILAPRALGMSLPCIAVACAKGVASLKFSVNRWAATPKIRLIGLLAHED